MIRDAYSSLKDNLKERTTNPFLGTFTMVLFIHHWKILYALFNFDSNLSLQDRLDYITIYIKSSSLWEGVVVPVFIALLIIILTYLLINTSRLITNFYEKKVTPWVYKITEGSSVVLKSDYDKLVQKTYQLEEKVNAERTKRLEAETERDKLEGKIVAKVNTDTDTVSESKQDRTLVRKIANNIVTGYLDQFRELSVVVARKEPIGESHVLNFCLSRGLLRLTDTGISNQKYYGWSPLGEEVLQEVLRLS